MPDWLKQAAVVEPRYPCQRGELDVLKPAPRAPTSNDFRRVKADDRFGQPLGIADREVLHAAVTVTVTHSVSAPRSQRTAPLIPDNLHSFRPQQRVEICHVTRHQGIQCTQVLGELVAQYLLYFHILIGRWEVHDRDITGEIPEFL